jgi:DNA-binding YbaB/EbfC family protein
VSEPPDIGKLLAQAQQMQAKVVELQRELALRRVEGSAGGGMVTAVATGELRIVELSIEPGLAESGDRQMIQDLCAAAVNAALGEAQRMVQQEFQKLSGGMAIPNPLTGGGRS